MSPSTKERGLFIAFLFKPCQVGIIAVKDMGNKW
jgi:hypothetical protein